MERGLWPCGRHECDVSVDKREDFIYLFLCVHSVCHCAFLFFLIF